MINELSTATHDSSIEDAAILAVAQTSTARADEGDQNIEPRVRGLYRTPQLTRHGSFEQTTLAISGTGSA